MKIPIFEEIIIRGFEPIDLEILVEDSRIGKVPCYINLSNLNYPNIEELVERLEAALLKLALHPSFPYPVYLITAQNYQTLFPTVRTVKDLPEHFFKKIKRPNNKELALLNKLALKAEKIKNLKLGPIYEELKSSANAQKKLYTTTKELYFLEFINEAIVEIPKRVGRRKS